MRDFTLARGLSYCLLSSTFSLPFEAFIIEQGLTVNYADVAVERYFKMVNVRVTELPPALRRSSLESN